MKPTNLEKWLTDPRSDEYFGRAFVLKFAVLVQHVSGRGTLAEISRAHGVSKAAMTRHALRARQIFGDGKLEVDSK